MSDATLRTEVAIVGGGIAGVDAMVEDLIDRCPDVVAADTFEGLVREVNRISDDEVNGPTLREEIECYDAPIDRESSYHNDDQLRLLPTCAATGATARTCILGGRLTAQALANGGVTPL